MHDPASTMLVSKSGIGFSRALALGLRVAEFGRSCGNYGNKRYGTDDQHQHGKHHHVGGDERDSDDDDDDDGLPADDDDHHDGNDEKVAARRHPRQ